MSLQITGTPAPPQVQVTHHREPAGLELTGITHVHQIAQCHLRLQVHVTHHREPAGLEHSGITHTCISDSSVSLQITGTPAPPYVHVTH